MGSSYLWFMWGPVRSTFPIPAHGALSINKCLMRFKLFFSRSPNYAPVFTTPSRWESNWEIWVAPPSYSDSLPAPVNFLGSVRCKRLWECMRGCRRLTTLLFISFTPSPALCSMLRRDVDSLQDGWNEEKEKKSQKQRRGFRASPCHSAKAVYSLPKNKVTNNKQEFNNQRKDIVVKLSLTAPVLD